MWKVAKSSILGHKIRFLMTSVAVVLGIAFLSGTLVLAATINSTFDDLFADIFEGTDVVVRGVEPVESSFFGQTPRLPVSRDVLNAAAEVDGVAVAEPSVDIPYAQVVTDGDVVGDPEQGAPTFGTSWTADPDLNPMVLQSGSEPPRANDEIVIDKGTADKGDIEVGDRVTVLTSQPVAEFTVSGIAKFGSVDSPLGASVVMFTLERAQSINDYTANEFSTIGIVGEDGISQEALATRVRNAVTSPEVEVVTGAELTKESEDQVDQFVNIFSTVLLVFAGIALLVAFVIIYNTFSIIVAQRTKEMALLRAIGASRRQVTGSIAIEGLGVGLLASVLGFLIGILLANGLQALLAAIGFDIPTTETTIPLSAPIASLVVGTVVTVGAAVVPALRASRVPPVAAMREVAIERRKGLGVRIVIGSVITTAGAGAMLYGLFGSPSRPIYFVGAGALAIFLGVFALAAVIAPPLSRVIGAPVARLRGIQGTLARENAIRNPRRTAATASALMIGVALVGFITIFAASAKKSISYAIDQQLQTDFIVTGGEQGFLGISPELAATLAEAPELTAVTSVRFGAVEHELEDDFNVVTGANLEFADEVVDFEVTEGSLPDVTIDGISISRRFADDNGFALGDKVPIQFPAGPQELTVQAIYERFELADDLMVYIDAFQAYFLQQQQVDFLVLTRLADGITPDEGRAVIEQAIADGGYATAQVQNNAEYKANQEAQIDQFVNLVYGLLMLSIVIASIGIIITLVLAIYERTRELGLLRAVGMTRAQMRSSVRWESVIVALLGTALGLAIGLFFGWAVVQALKDEGFSHFAAAPVQLLFVVIIAIIVGMLAAIYPAWRASKLDILRAISSE